GCHAQWSAAGFFTKDFDFAQLKCIFAILHEDDHILTLDWLRAVESNVLKLVVGHTVGGALHRRQKLLVDRPRNSRLVIVVPSMAKGVWGRIDQHLKALQ